jgi:hypothetical protein
VGQGKATCARCGRGLGLACDKPAGSAAATVERAEPKSPLQLGDWKLEDDLREAQRLVRLIQLQCDEPLACEEETASEGPSPAGRASANEPVRESAGGASLLTWLVLGCGLSGLVCGVVLLVWSQVSERSELWHLGLPVAVVSQALLATGLLLQSESRKKPAAAQSEARTQVEAEPAPWQINSAGALHASGVSLHFSAAQQAVPTSRQIKQQIDAALRRRSA